MAQVKAERYFKEYTYSFVFAAGVSAVEAEIDPKLGLKGEVVKMIVVIPDWINTVSAVITAINKNDKEIFATDPKAQNEEYAITLVPNECVILGKTGEKYKVTLSGVPGGSGGTVTLTVYLEG